MLVRIAGACARQASKAELNDFRIIPDIYPDGDVVSDTISQITLLCKKLCLSVVNMFLFGQQEYNRWFARIPRENGMLYPEVSVAADDADAMTSYQVKVASHRMSAMYEYECSRADHYDIYVDKFYTRSTITGSPYFGN